MNNYKIDNFFNHVITFLLIFYITFGVFFYNASKLFKYTDELFTFSLLLVMTIFKLSSVAKYYKYIFLFSAVVLLYLFYSINLSINTHMAIFSDTIVEIKAFIAFFLVYISSYYIRNASVFIFRTIVIVLSLGLFTLGIMGTETIWNFFSHPSRYYSIALVLGLLYLSTYNKLNLINLTIALLIVSLGLISMKAKFFGEYIFFIALSFYFYNIQNNHSLSFSPGVKKLLLAIVLPVLLTVIWFLTKDKILFYFIEGVENPDNMFARPALYIASVKIFFDYFPFGSGFASFGSYFSANLGYSAIYEQYNLSTTDGLTEVRPVFIADTYFPMLIGQFGVIGLLLFIYFFYYIYKKAYFLYKANFQQNALSFMIIVFILILLLIESIADATIAQNRGVMYMIILAINMNKLKNKNSKGYICVSYKSINT